MASTSTSKKAMDDQHLKFQKRKGTSGISGQLYEIELSMLFLLQGITDEKITNFHLATNMEEAGNFDDVVFKYKCKDEEQSKIIFLQAKHKENENKKMTLDLLLEKYFDSYLKIKQQFNEENKNSPIFGCNFEDCNFIIYTNAPIKDMGGKVNIKISNIEENSILNLYKNNCYCELTYNSYCQKIKENYDVSEIEIFLSKFKLYFNQPNQTRLSEIIQKKLMSVYGIENDEINLIYTEIQNKVKSWWQEEERNEYLTENSTLFLDAKQYLSKLQLDGLIKCHTKQIKSLGLSFSMENIKGLIEVIDRNRIINIVTNKHISLLSRAKVYQAIENKNSESENNDYNYIFLSISDVVCLQNKVIDTFESKKSNLLVIECNELQENARELYNPLFKIIRFNKNKKIVLIAHMNDLLAGKFKNDFFGNGEYEEIIDESNKISDLTTESQEKLFNGAKVIFQGKEVNLNTLIDTESRHLINEKVLLNLINNETIEICKPPSDLSETASYYIDRTFDRHIEITEDVEKDEKRFVFYVGKEIIQTRNENQDIISISEVDEDFKKLCHIYKERNIHWLKKESNKFIWQKSYGSLKNLDKFINKQEVVTNKPEKITDINDRIVIISDKPGMGKSTILTKLIIETKDTDPSLWVIRINLNDYTSHFDETHFHGDKKAAIEFVSNIVELKTPLEKDLFKLRVNCQGKIALIFDGFDEISPDYKDKVEELLRLLLDTKVEKLWITTRPQWRNELENRLGVFSYMLRSLSREDQRIFLARFWSKKLDLNLNINDNYRLNKYIKELLDVLSNSISDNEMEFTGVPLQTRMLAEAFQDKFQEFYLSGHDETNISDKLNQVSLYQLFIEKKIEIYSKEKKKEDLTKPSVKEDYKKLCRSFIREHKLLALTMLFSNQMVNEILSPEEKEEVIDLINYIKLGKEKTGIINQIIDDKPSFIHRTFAEYLAASWFAETKNQGKQEVKNFLHKNMRKEENKVLIYFFDRLLIIDDKDKNKYNIHVAVLNNDETSIKSLLADVQQAKDIIDSRDKAGRTALHLAVIYGYVDIVKVLLDLDADINIADNIFGWRPLVYADKYSYWNIAELLLLKGANKDDMIEITNKINDYDYDYDYDYDSESDYDDDDDDNGDDNYHNYIGVISLHKIVKNGFRKLTEVLVERGANVNDVNINGNNVLCRAAKKGNLDIIKYLIEHNADINNSTRPLKYFDNARARTPIIYAILNDKLDVVKLLSENGADLNITDISNNSPLYLAAGKENLDICKVLIENGADLKIISDFGESPLDVLTYGRNLDVLKKILLEKQPYLKFIDNNFDKISLHLAVLNENLDVLKVLIKNGADLNVIDNYFGKAPLHLAVYNENLDVIKLLIENGANLNITDISGKTALYLAVYISNMDVLKLLIEKGCDLNIGDMLGKTPSYLAASCGMRDFFKKLIKAGADVLGRNNHDSVLHQVVKSNNEKAIRLILEEINEKLNGDPAEMYENINPKDTEGDTPLMCAVRYKKNNLAKILLEYEADPNVENNIGDTPMIWAAGHGKVDIIKKLIEVGANVLGRNNHDTVLHQVVRFNSEKAIRLILEKINEKLNGDPAEMYENINPKDTEGDTPLMCAVRYEKITAAKILLEYGADPNVKNNNGSTPLISVIKYRRVDIIKKLLEVGADVLGRHNHDTVLHQVVKSNNEEVIRLILKKINDKLNGDPEQMFENINPKDIHGNTPLMWAVENYETNTAKILLEYGANPNVKNNNGDTPLISAAKYREVNIIKTLIEVEADLLGKNNHRTVLHQVVRFNNEKAIRLILEKINDKLNGDPEEMYENINPKDTEGNTPLMYAVKRRMNAGKILLEYGADPNVKNNNGSTPLISAARYGEADIIKKLIEVGADVLGRNNHGTVLHEIVRYNNEQAIRLILEKINDKLNGDPEQMYENINPKDTEGNTPLMYAVKRRMNAGKILLEYGADPNVKNNNGSTPLISVIKYRRVDIIKKLIEVGADVLGRHNHDTILHQVVKSNNEEVIRLILKKINDKLNGDPEQIYEYINPKDIHGNTPLMWAVENYETNTAKILLEYGANPNVKNNNGDTPLISAAKYGEVNIIKTLIEVEADVLGKNNHRTVLHQVVRFNNEKAIRLILEKINDKLNGDPEEMYENINPKDTEGNTPLMYAVKRRMNAGKILLEYGADPNVKNNNGSTPLISAARYGEADIIKKLIEVGADVLGRNNHGTVLHEIVTYNNEQAIRLILEKINDKLNGDPGEMYENINPKDTEGNTPLMYAVKRRIIAGKLLLEFGADPNVKNNNGSTPLISAARYGEADIIKKLIEVGADVLGRNNHGTVLHEIVTYNNEQAIRLILEKINDKLNGDPEEMYENINPKDTEGNTPLMYAVKRRMNAGKILLEYGADPNVKNNNGNTPLISAARYGEADIIKKLIEVGADVLGRNNHGTVLHEIVTYNNEQAIRLILEKINDKLNGDPEEMYENINPKDTEGNTPLMYAVKRRMNAGKILLEYGADPNVKNNNGSTPLISVARYGEADIIKKLIEVGADVLGRNNHRTVLHEVVIFNNEQAITLILEKINDKLSGDPEQMYENLNPKDTKGNTPLMCAAVYGITNAAKILLEYEADPSLKNNDGETAFQLATKGGYQEIVQLLRDIQTNNNIR